MADEKAPSKAQQFLYQHGEKVGLGVAVGLLAIYVLMGVVLAEQNQSADAVKNAAASIEAQAGQKHPDKPGFLAPDLAPNSAMHDIEILKAWQQLPEPTIGASDWSVAMRTEGVEKLNVIKPEAEKPVLVPTLANFKAEAGLDGVKLTWTVNQPNDKDAEIATIESFEIERKNKATNKVDKFTEKNAKATSYLDKTAEKRGSYEYRVTPKARSKKGPATTSATSWAAATMMDEWNFTFVNPTPGNPGLVQIKIEKFDKEYGAVSVTKLHKEGQKIGVWEEELEEKFKNTIGEWETRKVKKETGLHRVSVPGKSVWIDFDTKATLNKIQKIEVVAKWQKCRIKRGSGGEMNCEGQEEIIDKLDAIEILYTDQDNKSVSLKMRSGRELRMLSEKEIDPADHPAAASAERCEAHGGKKVEADPEKEEKEKLEREAQKALGEAKAQHSTYDTLIKKYDKLKKEDKNEEAGKVKAEAEKAKQGAIDKYKEWLEKYKDTRLFKSKEKEVQKDLKTLSGG